MAYSPKSRNRSLRRCSRFGRRGIALRILASRLRIPQRVPDMPEAGRGMRATHAAPRCRSERRIGEGEVLLPGRRTPPYPLRRDRPDGRSRSRPVARSRFAGPGVRPRRPGRSRASQPARHGSGTDVLYRDRYLTDCVSRSSSEPLELARPHGIGFYDDDRIRHERSVLICANGRVRLIREAEGCVD